MELRTKTVSAVKWNFVSTFLSLILGIIQLWALSHILSPHEYGVISVALMIILALNIFMEFGLANSIIRQKDITELELSSLFLLNLVMGALIFLAAYFGSGLIAMFFRSPELIIQIKIMSFVFLLAPLGIQPRALLARELKFNFISLTLIITLLLNFLIVLSLAYIYKKAWVASIAYLISTGLTHLIFFSNSLRQRKLSFAFSWRSVKPHISYSIHLFLDSLINVVSINTYPALMARIVSLTAIGGYNIASNISINLLERLKPILNQALFPAFAKIQDNDSKISKNFLLFTTYGALINFPILIGIFITSDQIVKVFFSEEWYFITGIMKVLCLVGIFKSIDAPVILLLLIKSKMYLNVRMGIFKLILGIFLSYEFGLMYGINGIVFSFLAVQILNAFAGYFVLVKSCLKDLGEAYFRSLLIPLLQLIPLIAVAALFNYLIISSNSVWNLLALATISAIAYIFGLYFSPFKVVQDFLQLAVNNISPRLEKFLKSNQKIF